MADVNRGNRPLSPHLQIYRPQLTSITSILTRITGNGLIVAGLLIVWWLLAAASGPEYFAVADGVVRSLVRQAGVPAVDLGDLVSLPRRVAAPVVRQRAAGWTFRRQRKLGWGVIGGSVVLTLLTVVIL